MGKKEGDNILNDMKSENMDSEDVKSKDLFKYSESQINGNQDSDGEVSVKSEVKNDMEDDKMCNGDVKSEEKVKEEKEEEDALAELKGCTQYDYQTDEIWDSSPYEPHIEDFELVVTSVEQLRELVLRFGPIPEDFGKKQEGVTVPKIKKKVGRPRFKNLKEDLKENNDGEEKENDEVNDDPEKETENNCEKENVSDNDKAVDEVTKDDKESKNKDIKKQA